MRAKLRADIRVNVRAKVQSKVRAKIKRRRRTDVQHETDSNIDLFIQMDNKFINSKLISCTIS